MPRLYGLKTTDTYTVNQLYFGVGIWRLLIPKVPNITSLMSLFSSQFLPPANEVCEGYVFYTCLSVHGGGGV